MELPSGYRALSKEELDKVNTVKAHCSTLKKYLDDLANGPHDARRLSIAKTHLENVEMWAVKSITVCES